MPSFREGFTQILIALVLSVGLGALIARGTTDRVAGSGAGSGAESAAPVQASSDSKSTPGEVAPTCRSLGVDGDSTREVTCSTRSAELTFVNGSNAIELKGMTARARSVEAYLAATEDGRRRNRMRVVVAFEATAERSVDPDVYLSIGGVRVDPDRAWRSNRAFSLSTPLAAGERRRGELRFELAGDRTIRFRAVGAQLAVRAGAEAGRPAQVGISRLGPPAMRELPGG